ncbi:subclass B2 metallo-beta-lactamase [Telmatospirillum sp.]|uniref:subclass B2 metallo-beta-lactamase n=1 Tax=Telmatospirillum sp. TaxID=2079197 RepID=UPI002841C954|nr:subclass B2 metallo-beta-lactamase [Telmatospirillum sp.]MDR3437221.1 subclass B2 metallo-beta-lactamase [Telmatospirillum sp.]
MKAFLLFLAVFSSAAYGAEPTLTLMHVRGGVYVVEDGYFANENSAVYVGPDHVTVVGATWTAETAGRLAGEIAKISKLPITEVIDTNYHPDRAGGNAYFKGIGARIVATEMTRDAMRDGWDDVIAWTRRAIPSYPAVPMVLPDTVYPGDFALQDGRVRALYLGPSHTRDGIFVWFPEEKILYGGCILKEKLGNLDFADVAEYPKTLRKLQKRDLGFTTVIAGHYSPLHEPELIDQYIALLEKQ